MPAIKATAAIDATQWDQGLRKMEARASAAMQRIHRSTSIDPGKSTVLNPKKDAEAYTRVWEDLLSQKDAGRLAAARAKKENRARLVEEYKANQERKALRGQEVAAEMDMEAKLARARRMRIYQNLRLSKEAREREQGMLGRARGFGGAASAMYVSVARDSAASLASGANPVTVAMQQTPQLLQALTMSTKEGFKGMVSAFKSGFTGLIGKLGGGTGAAIAAGGAVAAGATIVEGFRAAKAMLDERKYEAAEAATYHNIATRLAKMAMEAYAKGEISDRQRLNIIGILGLAHESASEMVRAVRANMPNAPGVLGEKIAKTKKGSGILSEMFLETIEDATKQAKARAKLERDNALLGAEDFEQQTTIPKEEYSKMVEAVYAARIKEIDAGKPRNATGIRFGSRVEFPIAFRTLPDHVSSIAKDMKTVADNSKPKANTGVNF